MLFRSLLIFGAVLIATSAGFAQSVGPKSATAIYLEYLNKLRTAESLDDIYPYLASSLSISMRDAVAKQTPENAKRINDLTIQTLRATATKPGTPPATPSIVETPASMRESTLLVTFPSYKLNVSMVIEAGQWHIRNEHAVTAN
jgi:hypothetical protein